MATATSLQYEPYATADKVLRAMHVSRTDARDGTSVLARRRRSTAESEQVAIEPAVLPAEIKQLPDLTGYAKTASSAVWHRIHSPATSSR